VTGDASVGAPELVVYWFPHGDFDTFPGRQYQLMRRLAARVPVVALTTQLSGAVRPPSVTIEPMDDPGLAVARLVLGAAWQRWSRRSPELASKLFGGLLRRQLARHGYPQRYVFWYAGIHGRHLAGLVDGPLVLDLIDPPFHDDSRTLLAQYLGTVASTPDLFFATARALAEEIEHSGAHAELLPNGCDEPPVEMTSAPPTPTLGYLGTLDWRFDWDLVEAVARRVPEWRVVLVGRVLAEMGRQADRLATLPNVELRGPAPHDVDPFATLADFSVGMIPFRTGFVGDAINPVKMYEYAAADLPVLATPIRECRDREPLVVCRPDADGWVAALPELVASRAKDHRERREFVSANTWTRRADDALVALRARRLVTQHDVVGATSRS
jgi:glycosyltransferase involved in cell wall biosynthesis